MASIGDLVKLGKVYIDWVHIISYVNYYLVLSESFWNFNNI
jgi:hypothetical protein